MVQPTSPLASKDQARFADLMNSKLDLLPVHNKEEARIVASALQALLKHHQEQSIPATMQDLQDRISDISDLMQDPLSVGDMNLYPAGHVQAYQTIARQRIAAKIGVLLAATDEEIVREVKRCDEDKRAGEVFQRDIKNAQPPTGKARTVSKHVWLQELQARFQGEDTPLSEQARQASIISTLINMASLMFDAANIYVEAMNQSINEQLSFLGPEEREAVRRSLHSRGIELHDENRFASAENVISYLHEHRNNLNETFMSLPE